MERRTQIRGKKMNKSVQRLVDAATKMYKSGHVVGCEYFLSEFCTCGKLEVGEAIRAINKEYGDKT